MLQGSEAWGEVWGGRGEGGVCMRGQEVFAAVASGS